MENSERASALCPYCNALLPALTTAPALEKLPCPRCGELVPASHWPTNGNPPAGNAEQLPSSTMHRTHRQEPNDSQNRTTMFVIVSVMAVMAVIGLSYMLWTTQLRRSRDPKGTLDPISFRRPLELKGLGYLPKNSEIIVGLQVAEWLNDKKVGKPLLEAPRPAAVDWLTREITRTLGMELKEIDHLLLATSLDAQFPQMTVVARTRRPIVGEKILEAKPIRSTLHEKLPLYAFDFQPGGGAWMWWVDEKTAIYVIRFDMPKVEHLRGLSATPRSIGEVLSAPVHDALKTRIAKYQFAWAVGRLDQLSAVKEALPFLPFGKADLTAFKSVKTFAIGLEPIEGLTLTGHFHASDAKSAEGFEKYLANVKFAGATSQKVEPSPADAPEAWSIWQVRGDAEAMRRWLNFGKEPKK